MSKAPAFQFYPSDFLASVLGMTQEERGAYITLLCVAWLDGSVPADEGELRQLLTLTPTRFERVWAVVGKRFEPDGNGGLVNPRLERVRQERAAYVEKARRAGRKGGRRGTDK